MMMVNTRVQREMLQHDVRQNSVDELVAKSSYVSASHHQCRMAVLPSISHKHVALRRERERETFEHSFFGWLAVLCGSLVCRESNKVIVNSANGINRVCSLQEECSVNGEGKAVLARNVSTGSNEPCGHMAEERGRATRRDLEERESTHCSCRYDRMG